MAGSSIVDQLLERMTLEEKVAQMSCVARVPEAEWLVDDDGWLDADALIARHPHGLGQLGRPSQKNAPAVAARLTNEIQVALGTRTRTKIRALFNEEGVHGHMAVGATSYPSAIALASTWDPAFVEHVYAAVAREVRARGSNYVYAPVLDLARDPRWGRVEETFGEDPHLVAGMGVAAVRGLQGTEWEIPGDRVLACAKHFAGHGAPEAGMNGGPLHAGERQLREEHLAPFEAVVREAGVGAIMVAYHEIDGIPCHTNRWLLTDLLRDEWGFEGLVTSDGFGMPQIADVHRVAGDEAEAARLAIGAGVDCEVPEPRCFSTLVDQVRSGVVDERDIDRATRNVLVAKSRVGLLGELEVSSPVSAEEITNHPDHRRLALEAARRSAVLLTNRGATLPLDPSSTGTVAVIGPNAADLHLGGYAEDPGRGVTVLEGIRARIGADRVVHAEGCRITEGPQGPAAWWRDEVDLSDPADQDARIQRAVEIAEDADAVVLVIGGNEATSREGWWFDHLGDRDAIDLPGRQVDLIEAVAATGTPVVAVVMGGRPLDLRPLVAHVASVLQVWYPGQEGGSAIAEILFGDVNPSGKLPITFPRSEGRIPVHAGRKPSTDRGYLFSSHLPLFAFGHGLSYTTFEYGAPRLSSDHIALEESVTVEVEVTNTGPVEGSEVVQCYIHDRVASTTRPIVALRGFQRIHLRPGRSETVRFELTPSDLSLIDRDMNRVVEPGEFDVLVGRSSVDLQGALLTVS